MIIKIVIAVLGLFTVGAFFMQMIHLLQNSNLPQRKTDWIKYMVFLVVVCTFLAAACFGRFVLGSFILILLTASVFEIWHNIKKRFDYRLLKAAMLLSIVTTGLGHIYLFDSTQQIASCVFLFLLVFTTDSYAQLIGRLVGRRHPCPRISPNKTIAGFVGGISMAILVAVACSFLLPAKPLFAIIILGLVIGLSSIAGDLVFSAVKRRLGIKDFSSLLPGHGGILDRLDSMIVASPAFFWAQCVLDRLPGGKL